MFELNLIKDKAKARQRRRVIFMSIMMILLMSGLVSIFVGSLIYREQNLINKVAKDAIDLEKTNKALEADLAIEEPKSIKKRNGLIKACAESENVRNKRLYFAPALDDLFMKQPKNARFWYTRVEFTTSRPQTPGAAPSGVVDLLGLRTFNGNGHVQMVESDVRTQSSLEEMVGGMQGLGQLVGQPVYTSHPDQSVEGRGPANEETRYIRFSVRSQQYYSGGATGTP